MDISFEKDTYYAPYVKPVPMLCCVASCKKKFIEDRRIRSTFAFPKDSTRCAIWINKCGVEHLKSIDPALLNKKYRLCADHFEDSVYANFQKNRLKSDAVPTLFDHQEVSETVSNKLNTNEFVLKCTGLSEGTVTVDNDLSIASTSSYSMSDASKSTKVDTSSTCIETPKFLSDTTPRKVSLRNQLANKVAQRKELENKCKLKEGVTDNRILGDVGNEINLDSGTKILIDKKDIHNIKRDFNINGSVLRHQNDALSVKLWVKEMEKEEDNCVIFFKEQGQEDSNSLLKKEDFVLIIMTAFQREMLKKYANDKICLDGTHGLNSYNFILYLILIVDEFKNGCPVAFCFSNRSSEELFNVYFKAVKSVVGTISCKTFMTDDAPAFYNAWCEVMGPVPNVLLCTWHVTRNWQQNLSKIKKVEKKKLVYKTAKTIKDELCKETFSKLLEGFLSDLLNDEDTVEFGKYFSDHYAARPEKWAYCYRKNLGINTNVYLESLHRKIKYQYWEGKHVKRLDIAISGLLKLLRDLIFQRLIKVTKKSVSSDRMNRINKSHKLSLETKPEIVLLSEDKWQVQSFSGNNLYTVHKVEEECGRACHMKCFVCDICIHSFTCTCIDNVIRGNICKHIHCIAQTHPNKTQSKSIEVIDACAVASECQDEFFKTSLKVLPITSKASNINSSMKTKLENILAVIDESKFSSEQSEMIHKNLNNILDLCHSVQGNKEEKRKKNVNTRKKIKKQMGYFSTKKKMSTTSRPKNPSTLESQNIREGLLSKSEEVLCINTDFDHTYICKYTSV